MGGTLAVSHGEKTSLRHSSQQPWLGRETSDPVIGARHKRASQCGFFYSTGIIWTQTGLGIERVCPVGLSFPLRGSIRNTTTLSVS